VNPFEALYQGSPPWEIGRPQPFVEGLIERGAVTGSVLDVGCGTGDNAIALAAGGLDVTAVDVSATAIRLAEDKARARGEIGVRFIVGDALELGSLGQTFDTLLDSAVFHVFSDDARVRYARSLARVSRPGTQLYLLCFSEQEPDWGGPRRVTQAEIRATFGRPWAVERVEPARYVLQSNAHGANAWLASIVYIGRPTTRDN
jgi:ubiquinone/menaquinone biosynthesis C-methylase UbiE